ncbi:hypothetical protein GCK72_021502 [Caenorhabditis remanei]|uniref:Tyrosine-protein phosphatase domain-containing protein n=1 Tax=Caenorhabditis remanei TaxID=31234 RepID=A0A6A5GIB9_CAERE|nr:hypothetical protein GCK72_021502 [Caenorhabditis remanei]KAF1754937.1 hypothetical protein GCK72_021502 [Caenorhabditis remanei]
MKIWLLLVAAISAYANKDPPESNHRLYGGENYPTDALHRTSAAASFRRRFDRNAGGGDLATHVNYLQMMARITNGIHILKSGMDKSLDSDQFISEILHFGDVTPAQIIALNPAQDMKSRLESLPEELKATDNAEKVELAFDWLKKVLTEIDGIGDIREWKEGNDKFKKEIERLGNHGIPSFVLSQINIAASTWTSYWTQISAIDSQPTPEILNEVKSAVSKLKENIPKFETSGPFWSFNNFSSAIDGISPVLKTAEAVKFFVSASTEISFRPEEGLKYNDYLDSAIKILNDTTRSSTDFQMVSKLAAAREIKNLHGQLKHTFGFFNGPSDFAQLSADVLDPWILNVVKTKSLKTALDHLVGTSTQLKKIDSSLGGNLNGVKNFLDFLSSISTALTNIIDAKLGVPQGHNCSTVIKSIDSKPFNTLLETLKGIDKKLAELKSITDEISTLIKTPGIIQMCDDVIAIFEKLAADNTKIKSVLENFQKYPNTKALNDFFTRFTALNARIINLNLNSIKTEATNATSNMIALSTYQNNLGDYADYFVCLQNQANLKAVFKALDGLNRIRKWNNDKKYSGALTDGINTMSKVVGIKGDLETLQKSIGSLSDLKTKETDALKELKDAPIISQNIGKAVQGLAEMSLALEKRADVEKKFDDIKVVSDNKANVKDPGDLASLNKLVSLPGMLQKMYESLVNFDKTVGSFVRSNTFANQSGIFEKAKQVSGVTGDFSRMSVAVGNLKQTVVGGDADKLKEIEDALKTMDSLDLNFAGFHKDFNESKKSLEELDVFFAGFFAKFQPISATIAPGQTQPTGSPYVTVLIQRPWTSTQGGEDGTSDFVFYGSIAGGVFLFLVFVVLLHLCLHIWCRKCLVDHYWFKCIRWKPSPEMLIEYFQDFCYGHYSGLSDDIEYNRENSGVLTYLFYTKFYETDKTQVFNVDPVEIKVTDCRFSKPLGNNNRPALKGCENRFNNTFLHATWARFHTARSWWFTQGPQKKSAGKNSTIEKLFWLAKQEKTQSMVMLCALEENGAILCDRYYPEKEGESMEFDKLIVNCSKLETLFDKTLQVRTLDVKFDTEKQFSLTHYALKNWPENGYPTDLAPLIYLYNKLQKDKNPAIVHCSDGCKRTGPFGLAAIAYDELRKQRTSAFLKTSLACIKSQRVGSIETPKDYAFGGRLCLEILAKKAKLNDEQKEVYEDLKFGWENYEKGKVQYERMRETTTAKSSTTKI